VVSGTPRPYFTPGKDPVPTVQEAGWAPGPVWTGGKRRTVPLLAERMWVKKQAWRPAMLSGGFRIFHSPFAQ